MSYDAAEKQIEVVLVQENVYEFNNCKEKNSNSCSKQLLLEPDLGVQGYYWNFASKKRKIEEKNTHKNY